MSTYKIYGDSLDIVLTNQSISNQITSFDICNYKDMQKILLKF